MYVISIGKHGEAEILHGHVKFKEGAGVTITRIDADNALEIASAVAAVEGFGNDWQKYDPSGQMAATLDFYFDEVIWNVAGAGTDTRLFTRAMRTWGFRRPCSCEYKSTLDDVAGNRPTIYHAIVQLSADIRNNMNQPCIGWMTNYLGAVSCFNGDGFGFKKTDFAWGNWPPIWLKWERDETEIRFYANMTLVATHTTYLPIQTNDCFFALQAYGSEARAHRVHLTRPHYSAE